MYRHNIYTKCSGKEYMPVCLCMLILVHRCGTYCVCVCLCLHWPHDGFYLSHRGERGVLPFREIKRFLFQRHILQCRAPQILITAQQIFAFIHRVEGQLKMHITYKAQTFLTVPPERSILPGENDPVGASRDFRANHLSCKCYVTGSAGKLGCNNTK